MRSFTIELTERQCDTLAARSRLENREIDSDDEAEIFLASIIDKMIAAPDMYEAILKLVDIIDDMTVIGASSYLESGDLDDVKAALAKAEGKPCKAS